MPGVQVDLIPGAVQSEADSAVSGVAVKVIDEQGLHLLRRGCSVPHVAWGTLVGNPGCTSAQPHRYAHPPRHCTWMAGLDRQFLPSWWRPAVGVSFERGMRVLV